MKKRDKNRMRGPRFEFTYEDGKQEEKLRNL